MRTTKNTFRKVGHTQWPVPPTAAKNPEELSFTDVSPSSFKWWAITPPKTPYTQAHGALGQALAFELLDYLRNPAAQNKSHALGWIALEIFGEGLGTCRGQLLFQFFDTIGKYVSGEAIDR